MSDDVIEQAARAIDCTRFGGPAWDEMDDEQRDAMRSIARDLHAAGLLAVTPTSKPTQSEPRELLDRYAASEYDIVLESEYAVPPVTGSVPRTAVAPAAFAVLRAVLDLHSPVEQHGATWCAEDGDYWWPCPTVQAITTALTTEEATDA